MRSYYTREICAETVGLWQLWLDATLCEIMPTYNQLYKTTVYEFNPLYNTNITTTFTKTTRGTDTKSGSTTNSSTNNKTDDYEETNDRTVTDSGKTLLREQVNITQKQVIIITLTKQINLTIPHKEELLVLNQTNILLTFV